MSKKIINVIVVETSHIIYEGIFAILSKSGLPFNFYLTDNFSELSLINLRV